MDRPREIALTWQPRRINPSLALMGAGLLLIGGSLLPQLHGARSTGPGSLVARESEVVWRSPERSSPDGITESVAAFELVNTGGAPVRVKDVRASCGCTEADVQPKTIKPGHIGLVKVKATGIPVGERVVTVVLSTDSPLTPHVDLILRVVGSRRPPFLLRAFGDLTYLDDPSAEEPREITAICAEMKGTSATPPILRAGLPFLAFGPPIVDEKPYFDPNTVCRKYVYKAKFVPPGPPKDLFSGEVWVADPWDAEHRERILVSGRTVPALRVIPSRLILDARQSVGHPTEVLTFSVLSKESAADITVGFDGSERPFELRRIRLEDDGRRSVFSIRLMAGKPIHGEEFALSVHRASSPGERIVVPVLVRTEGQP